MNRVIKTFGEIEFVKVGIENYSRFIFMFNIINAFFIDWSDGYDWSLSSGKYEQGTLEYANECLVCKHYYGSNQNHYGYWLRLDYIKEKGFELEEELDLNDIKTLIKFIEGYENEDGLTEPNSPRAMVYRNIKKDLLLLELIKKTCIITIREIQGQHYLFIGNSIKGARPLTKEEMEILNGKQ